MRSFVVAAYVFAILSTGLPAIGSPVPLAERIALVSVSVSYFVWGWCHLGLTISLDFHSNSSELLYIRDSAPVEYQQWTCLS